MGYYYEKNRKLVVSIYINFVRNLSTLGLKRVTGDWPSGFNSIRSKSIARSQVRVPKAFPHVRFNNMGEAGY